MPAKLETSARLIPCLMGAYRPLDSVILITFPSINMLLETVDSGLGPLQNTRSHLLPHLNRRVHRKLKGNCALCQVASLLSAQQSLWKVGVQRLVGSWVLRRFGVQEDWLAPARLDFVYDDEEANMPIHYIALGSPVSLCAIHLPCCAQQGDAEHGTHLLFKSYLTF